MDLYKLTNFLEFILKFYITYIILCIYIVLGERNGVPIGPTVKLFYPLLNSEEF